MNWSVLIALVFYYIMMSLVFFFGHDQLNDFNTTIDLTNMSQAGLNPEQAQGVGVLTATIDFTRYLAWTFFGIGLPEGTPTGIVFALFAWQTMVTIFLVGFIISSVWNG